MRRGGASHAANGGPTSAVRRPPLPRCDEARQSTEPVDGIIMSLQLRSSKGRRNVCVSICLRRCPREVFRPQTIEATVLGRVCLPSD